jgi:transcriptional regulator with XRE-family HTH domain
MRYRALALFGRTVRRLRKQRKLSQEALAIAAGMHLNHVSAIERGERNPGLLSVLKIAKALDVPVTDLFDEFPPRSLRRMRV